MARASFELTRLELDDGRLLVSGWWSGVRGMRFVRPALLVDGRKMLATLEHKPWAVAADGSWTAAFPWKEPGPPDVGGVTLAVAPSVEVPLDAEAAPPEAVVAAAPPPPASPRRVVAAAASASSAPPPPADAAPGTGDAAPEPLFAALPSISAAPEVVEIAPPAPDTQTAAPREDLEIATLRAQLRALERRLEVTRDELHETRAIAAEREARCRELEQAVAARRREVDATGADKQEMLHAQAMAVLDRDRAIAQHEEAVADREAAVRTRTRMEAQREEAVQARAATEARRDATIAERDEMRRQRDEVLVAHRALQDQRKGEWAAAQRQARDEPRPAAAAAAAPNAGRADLAAATRDAGFADLAAAARADGFDGPPTAPDPPIAPDPATAPFAARAGRIAGDTGARERPSGVRVIPAARTVATHLHRAHLQSTSGVTSFDLWVIRILGSVAALAFIALLVMLLKAFFVF